MSSDIQNPVDLSKHGHTDLLCVSQSKIRGRSALLRGIGECGCKSTALTGEAEMSWGEECDCG